jgi:vancomycin resistance protein YoaR
VTQEDATLLAEFGGDVESRPSRRRLRLAVLFGLVLVTLIAAYVGAYAFVGAGVPRGTEVAGVDIGGLPREAAMTRLRTALAPRADEPIQTLAAGQRFQIEPSDISLELDTAATVDAAGQRSLNPTTLLPLAFRAVAGGEVAPRVEADAAALAKAVSRIAKEVDVEPTEGDVQFANGEAVAVSPRSGARLDRPASAAAIVAGYPGGDRSVQLPVTTLLPLVGADEVDRTMRTFAEPAMAAPVTLALKKENVRLSPRLVGAHVQFTVDDGGALVPKVDGEGLIAELGDDVTGVTREPVDATFEIVDDEPRVVPARRGREIDVRALSQAMVDVLPRSTGRRVEVPVSRTAPDLTTAEARGLGVVEQVSTFTTYHPYAAYRSVNIHRGADLLDGTVLLPGETFSFDKTIGKRTPANGFIEGTIISNGRFKEGTGGGVSQLVTTTYNAAFFAGLKDVEHHPHTLYINRYPEGREATVAWGSKDLRFRNNSKNGIFITTSYTDTSVTVTMWGTERFEVTAGQSERYNVVDFETIRDDDPRCLPQGGVPGFQVHVYRTLERRGRVVDRETYTAPYAPTQEVFCVTESVDGGGQDDG